MVSRLTVAVEMWGGIRDDATLTAALAGGCRRVDLGTAALEDPGWTAAMIERHGGAVAIGLDVRGTTLAARGWTRDGGGLWAALARLDDAGCARYGVTDVTKDGAMRGPNVDLLREVCARTPAPVVASSGIYSLADLETLRRLVPDGLEGAIVGEASTPVPPRRPRRSMSRPGLTPPARRSADGGWRPTIAPVTTAARTRR